MWPVGMPAQIPYNGRAEPSFPSALLHCFCSYYLLPTSRRLGNYHLIVTATITKQRDGNEAAAGVAATWQTFPFLHLLVGLTFHSTKSVQATTKYHILCMRQKLMVTPNVQILRSFEIWIKTMHIYKCGKNYRSRLQKLKVLMQNYFPCKTSFETFFPAVAKILCTKRRWVKTKDCAMQSSRSKFCTANP